MGSRRVLFVYGFLCRVGFGCAECRGFCKSFVVLVGGFRLLSRRVFVVGVMWLRLSGFYPLLCWS